MTRILSGLSALAVAVALFNGCSSDDEGAAPPASCKTNPLSCGAGKTCWVTDLNGGHSCLDAKPNTQPGDPCTNVLGQAQCGEGQYCFPDGQNSMTGTCSPFCVNGSCANGAACFQIALSGVADQSPVLVCQPTSPADAGNDGSGGSAGMGGSAGTGTGGSGGMATGGSGGIAAGGSGGMAAGGAPADAGAD